MEKLRSVNFSELAALYPDEIGKFVRSRRPAAKGIEKSSTSGSSGSAGGGGGGETRSSRKQKSAKFVFIDWTNAAAVRALVRCQLKHVLDVDIHFHPERLCPPLLNRANYLQWLHGISEFGLGSDRALFTPHSTHDSISLSSPILPSHVSSSSPSTSRSVKVLDVGTGSSAIYAILGNRLYGWDFLCSDVDPVSVAWAREQLSRNLSLRQIEVVAVEGCPSWQLEVRNVLETKGSLRDFLLQRAEAEHVLCGGDKGRDQRGPIRQALAETACCRPSLLQAEAEFFGQAAVSPPESSEKLVFLDITMCNPPFYSVTEKVTTVYMYTCLHTLYILYIHSHTLSYICLCVPFVSD